MINELKQGVHDLELKVHDLELELLSRDHAQEKFEQQMISQVQSLREQVASLEGAAQVVHDGQAEENRRMGERVEQLERSVSDMRRNNSTLTRKRLLEIKVRGCVYVVGAASSVCSHGLYTGKH